ncbi:MAG TPA: ribonuclease HII [Syntrophus sp. (in: bacteria)]|nr:ribonuclease HII [Syntrophus sp. (in: bacteria)]
MRAAREMGGFERAARGRGYRLVAGIDEAGRGPLAGPVIAAAVILPPEYRHPQIRDSKTLSPRQRERLLEVIERDAVAIGIGVVEPQVIDTVNILQATLAAMKEAVLNLFPPPDYLLIDGISRIAVALPQETIVGGDGSSISVASASIVAKVSRDRIMEMYHRQFPQYNFLKNKGYGTPEHLEAILKYGRCKIHRCSFRVSETETVQENEKLTLA